MVGICVAVVAQMVRVVFDAGAVRISEIRRIEALSDSVAASKHCSERTKKSGQRSDSPDTKLRRA